MSKHLPVMNEAERDTAISGIEATLAVQFNVPALCLSHAIRHDDAGKAALFLYISDLDNLSRKVPYEVFFAAYDMVRRQYQTQIDLYAKAMGGDHWDIPRFDGGRPQTPKI